MTKSKKRFSMYFVKVCFLKQLRLTNEIHDGYDIFDRYICLIISAELDNNNPKSFFSNLHLPLTAGIHSTTKSTSQTRRWKHCGKERHRSYFGVFGIRESCSNCNLDKRCKYSSQSIISIYTLLEISIIILENQKLILIKFKMSSQNFECNINDFKSSFQANLIRHKSSKCKRGVKTINKMKSDECHCVH